MLAMPCARPTSALKVEQDWRAARSCAPVLLSCNRSNLLLLRLYYGSIKDLVREVSELLLLGAATQGLLNGVEQVL